MARVRVPQDAFFFSFFGVGGDLRRRRGKQGGLDPEGPEPCLLLPSSALKEKKKKKKKKERKAKKGILQARGFEPLPLTRMAPKATALTTRPNLHPSNLTGEKKVLETRIELVTSCV